MFRESQDSFSPFFNFRRDKIQLKSNRSKLRQLIVETLEARRLMASDVKQMFASANLPFHVDNGNDIQVVAVEADSPSVSSVQAKIENESIDAAGIAASAGVVSQAVGQVLVAGTSSVSVSQYQTNDAIRIKIDIDPALAVPVSLAYPQADSNRFGVNTSGKDYWLNYPPQELDVGNLIQSVGLPVPRQYVLVVKGEPIFQGLPHVNRQGILAFRPSGKPEILGAASVDIADSDHPEQTLVSVQVSLRNSESPIPVGQFVERFDTNLDAEGEGSCVGCSSSSSPPPPSPPPPSPPPPSPPPPSPPSPPPPSPPPPSPPPPSPPPPSPPPPPPPVLMVPVDTNALEPNRVICNSVVDNGKFRVTFPAQWPGGTVEIRGTSYDYGLAPTPAVNFVGMDADGSRRWTVAGAAGQSVYVDVIPIANNIETDQRTPLFTFTQPIFMSVPTSGDASVVIRDDFEAISLVASPSSTKEGSSAYGAFYVMPVNMICAAMTLEVNAVGAGNAGTTKALPNVDYVLKDQSGALINLTDANNDGIWYANLSPSVTEIRVYSSSDTNPENDETVDAVLRISGMPNILSYGATVTIIDATLKLSPNDSTAEEPNLIYCDTVDNTGSVKLDIPDGWPRGGAVTVNVSGTAIYPRDYGIRVNHDLGSSFPPINWSQNGMSLSITLPTNTAIKTIYIYADAIQNFIEADPGRTVIFTLVSGGGGTGTVTISDVLERGQLTSSPTTTQEGSPNYGTFHITGSGGRGLCTDVYLQINVNPTDSATPGLDYVLQSKPNPPFQPVQLNLSSIGGGLYQSELIALPGPFADIDVNALLDNLREGTEKVYGQLVIPAITLNAGEQLPKAQVAITEDPLRYQMILGPSDPSSEEPNTLYCPSSVDPYGAVKITVAPAWGGGTVNLLVSTFNPTPGVDFGIGSVLEQDANGYFYVVPSAFNLTTGLLTFNIDAWAKNVFIGTAAYADTIETDPETIQFNWGVNDYPNIEFVGSGAVNIADQAEGIGLTADPDFTYEFWEANAPGVFHVKPDNQAKYLCTSVQLRIDASAKDAATPTTDYGLVTETGVALQLTEEVPGSRIYISQLFQISNDNDFQVYATAINDRIREGDEFVRAELVVPALPNENDKATVTIKEEYYKAEIRKEEKQAPECNCTCPVCDGELIKFDIENQDILAPIVGNLLGSLSDPLRSAYPVARLVIPLPSNKAVPTAIDVELYTVVKNSNAPFGRDVKRVIKSFTVYPYTLLSEGANPRAPQPGDKLFVNFQLDLLPEMLSGGASSNTNIELLASPTFAPTTSHLQKFSGWWGSAPFTTSNPFALEQLTGLPAAINWAIDRLYASQETLVPDPADNGKLIPETGTTLSRRDGSESWYKNGSARPPETLSKLSGNTLTLRDGAKTIFSGSPSGYASSSVDQSGNVTTYSMIKALSSWGTGAAGTMTDAYGRVSTVTYGAPAGNGARTFSIADPWGAVTTVTWTPNGGVWAPAYNLPVGYNLWRIDASAASLAYTVSNGGVLSVLYPDPDGTGPRQALQNVYNFSSNWFLSGITSGEVGQAPIQTYSFAYDFDLAKPPGEIGSRGMLSITHNDITTTIDFARRRQDLGQYSLPLGVAHKALVLKWEDLIANPGADLSPYYDITSYTDGNGNRTLYRMDHRGRGFQVMDAYFVKLLGLDTLDLSVSANLSLVNQKLKANASITTQYVLSPVFRDPWGRVIGEDRGEVLVAKLPDPDDFTLRTDLPAADRTNGPLSRPQYTSAFSEGNRTNLLSPLTNAQTWVYNDQFDIPTLYTDEHGIQTVQTVDTSLGRVTHQRSGNTSWQNKAQSPGVDSRMDVDNDGGVSILDLLTVINYINSGAPSVLPAYRTVDSFLDVNGDGSVNAMDSQPIWDYFSMGGPARFPILGPNSQSMVDYEYTSTGTLPRGMLTKQSVYTGRGTIANPDKMVTTYAYYNVPGDPSKHGMISSITEAPNTAVTAVTTYEYDSRANVNKVTDSMGRVTKYFYDKLDRLTSVIGPDPDGAGPLISPMVRYDYNVYGRLIATEVINSTIDSTGALFVTSLVDGNSYDNFQRLTGEFQQKGETIWYVTGIGATGVTRSLTPAAPASIDLQALGAANTRISTSSAANSTVTPVTDTANQGLVKKYQFDKNHNMVSVEVSNAGADARITKITYDRANRPVMVVTPNPGGSEAQNVAGEIRNANAAAGEIGGYVSTTIFDNINQTWRTTDTQGTAINYRYDDLGRTKSVTVPGPTIGAAALTTQYSYTSVSKTGWLVQQTDPNLHISSVQYDYLGNVIKSTAPDGGVMGATYFGDGQVRRPVMSAEPNTEVRVGYADYDVRGRRTILSDLFGETTFSYRVDGSLNSVTDSMSRTTSFTYDAAGRVTKQTSPDPDGTGPLLAAASFRSFDSLGNVLNSHNDTSTGTTLAYDGRFRAISSTDSVDAATLFKYNVYGQTTQVEDAKQNKTTYDYDRLNRQFKETKLGYGSRTSALDGVGNVQSYVDRNGRTTLYEYNKLYDVTKETWVNPVEGNGVNNYEYDATGRLVSAADNKGNSNIFTYDINDRVDTERVFIAGVSPYVGAVLLDNDFNQRGLRTKVSTTIGTTVDAVNDYTYDNRNMMTSVKQSGANVTDKLVNFTYNASGQLDTINRFKTLTPQSLVASSKYQYDGAGRVQVITHSKTAISTGWNGTDVSTTTTDPILAAYFLKYDQSNRVTSFASRFDKFSTAYSYDTRDQLTGATTTPLAGATVTFTPPAENYVFDKTGNRTNGGTSTSANETHNRVQNDGTNTYLYDNEGNQISRTNNSTGEVTTYSYDYRNRLIKVASPGKLVSYQYDAFDRRIRKLVDDGGNGSIDSKTAWVWDGNQVIFQFKDPDGEGVQLPFKLTNRYLYGDIVDLILADEQVGVPGTGGGSVGDPMSFPIGSTGSTGSVSTEGLYRILWPLSDHLGTVRDLVDSNGTRLEHRVYDSFGKLLVETEDFTSGSTGSVGMSIGGGGGGGTTTDAIDSIFGYTGREWDKDVKLQFNRARWYDPASGRWISQDPIGFAAGDANLYRYVGNKPINAIDPSGLEEKATEEDIKRAREILNAAGIDAETIKLRIGILTNSMKTKVGFGDYRSPSHWSVNSDNYYVSSNPLAAINDLWTFKRGSNKQKIQCNKYSKLIILKSYIDLALPSQRYRMHAALANKSLPNDLPNGGDGLIFTREERGAPGFKVEELLPGDQVWFINPFYDKLPANIANEDRFRGEQGSNVFYLGDGMFMDIYTGNKKSLAEMHRYVHQYNCSSWAKFDAADYPILVRNTPLPNPF